MDWKKFKNHAKKAGKDFQKATEKAADELKKNGEDLTKAAQKAAGKAKNSIDKTIDQARENAKSDVDHIKKTAQDTAKKAEDTAKGASRNIDKRVRKVRGEIDKADQKRRKKSSGSFLVDLFAIAPSKDELKGMKKDNQDPKGPPPPKK